MVGTRGKKTGTNNTVQQKLPTYWTSEPQGKETQALKPETGIFEQ